MIVSTGRLRRQHWSSDVVDVVRLKAASRLRYRPPPRVRCPPPSISRSLHTTRGAGRSCQPVWWSH
ncbi:hypothetical protein PLICRDRAFT_47453, partial [Plicaturopsis crispa FD-325 SS-3]